MRQWKYHKKHKSDNSTYNMMKVGPFLFNLQDDENESYNQLAHYPEVGIEMAEEIQKMQQSLKENTRGWIK